VVHFQNSSHALKKGQGQYIQIYGTDIMQYDKLNY
jgi:hypothetical protein